MVVSRRNLTADTGCRGGGGRDRLTETSPEPRPGNGPETAGGTGAAGTSTQMAPTVISTGRAFQSRVG